MRSCSRQESQAPTLQDFIVFITSLLPFRPASRFGVSQKEPLYSHPVICTLETACQQEREVMKAPKRSPMSRSENMSRIRAAETRPEQAVRRLLWLNGLRYRKNLRIAGIRGDIVFRRQRIVVFLDGCFWHGCPEHFVLAKTRRDFWLSKLHENVSRDRNQTRILENLDWHVLRFWEHEVEADVGEVARKITCALHSPRQYECVNDWRVVDISWN